MTRLLIGYDGTDTARAAIAAAGSLFPGAEAVVASVHPRPPSLEAGAPARIALPEAMIREGIQRIRDEAQAEADAMTQDGLELAQTAGLRATAQVLTGLSAWRELRTATAGANADVVVCGTASRTAVERVVLGSTASSLLHHADSPLLVVPPVETPLGGPLIAGYDGSDGAREALRFMADHLHDRPVVVTHAWRSPLRHTLRGEALTRSKIGTFMDYVETVDTIWADVAQETADEGAEYARSLGMRASAATRESAQGDWRALVAVAHEVGATAILVGSRGRGAIASTVLGSVASGLVHGAEVPVLVVPPH